MDKLKSDILAKTFPEIFEHMVFSTNTPIGERGIEIEDGWYDLLTHLTCTIASHIKVERHNLSIKRKTKWSYIFYLVRQSLRYRGIKDAWRIFTDYLLLKMEYRSTKTLVPTAKYTQIKEKFGQLTIYIDDADEYIDGAISLASLISLTICETCGKQGSLVTHGAYRMRCSDCLKREPALTSARRFLLGYSQVWSKASDSDSDIRGFKSYYPNQSSHGEYDVT